MSATMKRFAYVVLAFALAVGLMPAAAWLAPASQASADEPTEVAPLVAAAVAELGDDADAGLTAQAAADETVKVAGVEYYSKAREVLAIVNKERTALGRSELKLDEKLTDAAMQRATELAIFYSHTRPDGSQSTTAVPAEKRGYYGENIAMGQKSATDVMKGWFDSERDIWNASLQTNSYNGKALPSGWQNMSSYELYQGEPEFFNAVGHYLNIINPDFKSIGIGCFVQGTYYWEQALSGEEPARITTGGTVEKSHRINIDYDVCGTDQGFNKNEDLTGKTLAVGETFEMHYDVTNDRWRYNYVTLDPSCVTWTSSDTSVCTVSPAGVVTARAVGKATVTATLPSGRSLSHEWTVVEAKPESTQVMYRLYNPNSGEHFYTASTAERDATIAAGWNDEGIGWTAPSESDTPVYRLYSGTDHHYTTSIVERDHLIDVGWTLEGDNAEGIAWYSDDQKRVPLYRQFNPNVDPTAPFNNSGSHNYTTSLEEHEQLISIGWQGEDIGWYGVS